MKKDYNVVDLIRDVAHIIDGEEVGTQNLDCMRKLTEELNKHRKNNELDEA